MILGEFMKKVKRKVNRKRIAIVVLIPVICIALLIANFTSIRLSIKGYHKEDKKVVYYIDSYYERMEDLNYLGYTTDVLFNNSDVYTISNLDTLISASVPYKKAKKYLAIKGAQIKDIKEYVDSGLKP